MQTPVPREAVLHALDLTTMREWDDAKALLEPLDDAVAGRLFLLVCDMEQAELARRRTVSKVRHEIGNALSVAQANLEGIADGVLEATPDRIEGVISALAICGALLDDLRQLGETREAEASSVETFNLCSLIALHVAAIDGLAAAKQVRLIYATCTHQPSACCEQTGDIRRIEHIVRNVMISALRYTPPGGSVTIRRADPPHARLVIAMRGATGGFTLDLSILERLVRTLGGEARLATDADNEAVCTVDLPVV